MRDECAEFEPLLAGYSLEALDSEERARVEAHLNSCPHCSASLREFEAVAEGLLHAARRRSPPARLRRRLLALIESPVSRGAVGERGRASLRRWVIVAGLVGLLALNLTTWWQVTQLQRTQEALLARLDNQTALALVAYPSTERAAVEGEGAGGTLLYDPERTAAVLFAWGLHPLADDQAYQAWLIRPDGERVSGGLFRVDEGAAFTSFVLLSSIPLGEYDRLGVTIEPAAGSPEPTGPRVLWADF
ncbi:MAG: anti-sigma factor [Chloroflexota bacterium]